MINVREGSSTIGHSRNVSRLVTMDLEEKIMTHPIKMETVMVTVVVMVTAITAVTLVTVEVMEVMDQVVEVMGANEYTF